jgi:hemerythrin-like domain-containing protein
MKSSPATADLLERLDLPAAPLSSLGAYLRWDHDRLGLLFHRAVERALAQRWASARADWWLYGEGLRRHFRVEEELLFPLIEQLPRRGGKRITAPLRLEHREIPALVAEMAQPFRDEDLPRLIELGADLALLLVRHERLEEEHVYRECAALLDADRESDLLGRALDLELDLDLDLALALGLALGRSAEAVPAPGWRKGEWPCKRD